MILTRAALILLTTSSLLACGADTANTTATPDATTVPDTAERDTSPLADLTPPEEVVIGEVCIGSRNFCVSLRESARCNADGSAIETRTPCEGASACEPLTGLCRETLCEPDAQQCADPRRVQTCAPDGSAWDEPTLCDAGLTCRAGKCRACDDGSVECLGGETYRRCEEDALGWTEPLSCPADHRCDGEGENAGCKRCTVERACAGDDRAVARCTSGLVTWEEESLCAVGQTCVDGRCEACAADTTECLSETTYRQCADDGSRWGMETACDEGEACFGTRCLPYACSPRVLFLVDYSGSMSTHWQSVREAVNLIITGNPDVRFGLKSFPGVDDFSCSVGAALELPFAEDNGATFNQWFEENPPSGGTPLAAGLEAIESNAEAIFGNLGGTVIVLTDGQDTCYGGGGGTPITAFLALVTAALRLEHEVPTYAIGYAFGGDTAELDTIANNGGTGYSRHIPATNASELADVLGGIIDRVKFCDLTPVGP
jgi:hypothetical protein